MSQLGNVRAWLEATGFGRFADTFEENEIDGEALLELTDEHLKDFGIALGPRLKLLKAIQSLRTEAGETPPVPEQRARGDSLATAVREAERRHLTVMFCDMVGSTTLAAKLDPEDMREVLRAYQDAAAGVIARFEGFVAKFMGDGVLAYFGYPRAHEDEAERAVRAGLALAATVDGLKTPDGEALAARIGIATGLVVVGDLVGEGAAQEQAVVGDTPNLAARLQAVAAPGQVVIADATRRLLGASFELRDLGEHELKGISGPAPAFAVTCERPVESRFEAMSGLTLSPMVGRDQELALLLERWKLAKAGEGQGVLLVGEAGIGKSRITRALLDALAEEPHFRIRYQCSPYHTSSALWPVIQQLNRVAGLGAGDSLEVRLDKLEMLLERAGGRDATPLIANLLGLDGTARYGPLDLEPQTQRARTLRALAEQPRGLAARQSVLMVLEDAHWIDPTTLELIEQCLDGIATARVLLVITSRPHRQPEVAAHPHVTRLTLNRLGRVGVEAIVARLGGDRLPGATIDAIIARSDGVPLYVEELTKAVLEAAPAGAGAVVPETLQDTLLARLDRDPAMKATAQLASCLGREFDYVILSAVADLPADELARGLEALVAAELVYRRGVPPDASYTFRHALVRDAAYETLLKSRRRVLHGNIADALAARPGTAPELLARHEEQAGRTETAVRHWLAAGRAAAARSADAEAIHQLNRALDLLSGLGETPDRARTELDVLIALGSCLIPAKGYAAPETAAVYARAHDLASEFGTIEQKIPVLFGNFLVALLKPKLQDALNIAEHILHLSKEANILEYLMVAHRAMGGALMWLGELSRCRSHWETIVKLCAGQRPSAIVTKYPSDFLSHANAHLSRCLLYLGFADQARYALESALSSAEGSDHASTIATVLYQAIHYCAERRDKNLARQLIPQFLAVADEHGYESWKGAGRAIELWSRQVNTDEDCDNFKEAMRLHERQGQLARPLYIRLLAEILICIGRPSEALSVIDEGIDTIERNSERRWTPELLCLRGAAISAATAKSTLEEVECYERAIMLARQMEARLLELRAATSLARLWADQDEPDKALDLLAPIYQWFTEGFDTPDLKDAKALLDRVGITRSHAVSGVLN